MLRVVFLINPDNETEPSLNEPQALNLQQLKGIRERVLPFIKKKSIFETISLHKDRDGDLKEFVQTPNLQKTICIASGKDGLVALTSMSRAIKGELERKKWLLIWVGHDYTEALSNSSCKIDLVVLPHWKERTLIEKFTIKKPTFKCIFDFIGIYSDMRRDFDCFTPESKHLPTVHAGEATKVVGFMLGGHFNGKILPIDLIEHWLKTIYEYSILNNEQLHFIIMDSPVTLELPDKGDGLRNIVIEKLKSYSTKFTFISCLETLKVDEWHTFSNDEPLKKIPMIINWIESLGGEIYVTGDNIGDAYNILGCTQSLQVPSVHILLPRKPSESHFIDPDFFHYYQDEWHSANYQDKPWMTISKSSYNDSRAFDDELIECINDHLLISLIGEEEPKESFMARICKSLSSFGFFSNKKAQYTSLDLSETQHGSSTTNPMIPSFTIE